MNANISQQKEKLGEIQLPTGRLALEELEAVLNILPVDISFVDKDDTVRYFNQPQERIFFPVQRRY